MPFVMSEGLLNRARRVLGGRRHLYWVVGAAGTGKTTVCRALAARYRLPVYPLDALIDGSYQQRFSPERHPANTAWLSTTNPLGWQLALSWQEFDQFNRAALVEYLDLLVEDVQDSPAEARLLVDGGVSTPAVLAQVLPANQIVALAITEPMSAEVWATSPALQARQALVDQLPTPQAMWRKLLDFDGLVRQTIVAECASHGIAICRRDESTSVAALAEQVAWRLGLG
jgi:hypothetical protein